MIRVNYRHKKIVYTLCACLILALAVLVSVKLFIDRNTVSIKGTVVSMDLTQWQSDGDGYFSVNAGGTQYRVILSSGDSPVCDPNAVYQNRSINISVNATVDVRGKWEDKAYRMLQICDKGTYIKLSS